MEIEEIVLETLAHLSRKLLDLDLRNPLLNFRFSDRSRRHIRIIDELPDVLLGKLQKGEKLQFKSLPEPDDLPEDEKTEEFRFALEEARGSDEIYKTEMEEIEEGEGDLVREEEIERALRDRVRVTLGMPPVLEERELTPREIAKRSGLNPSYELPEPTNGDTYLPHHEDNEIQTLLLPKQMDRKLSGIAQAERSNIEERGVNTLYLALGFLEWFDADHSDISRYAPLVLLPIQIKKNLLRGQYRYTISSFEEESELQTNLPLRERLRQDFGHELPELISTPDDNSGWGSTVEEYLVSVRDKIANKYPRWRVRRFGAVGIITFARLVMRRDIEPESIVGLSDGVIAILAGQNADGHDTTGDVRESVFDGNHPSIVTDMDASQYSAIRRIQSGKSIVIKGPPGTGKSETITNIITSCLGENKTVLFLAEKMAALEVVKDRLDKVGLGDFCLEIHSTKTKKKTFLHSLETRIDLTGEAVPDKSSAFRAKFETRTEKLRTYGELINRTYGNSSMSIRDILWASNANAAEADRLELPRKLVNIKMPAAKSRSSEEIGEARELFQSIEVSLRRLSSPLLSIDEYPLWGIELKLITPFQKETLVDALTDWKNTLNGISADIARWHEYLGIRRANTTESLEKELSSARMLVDLPIREVDWCVLERILSSDKISESRESISLLKKWIEVREQLSESVEVDKLSTIKEFDLHSLQESVLNLMSVHTISLVNVVDISRVLRETIEELRKLAATDNSCLELLDAVGMKSDRSSLAVYASLYAASILQNTPENVLRIRTVALCSKNNEQAIDELCDTGMRLRDKRSILEQTYFLPDDLNHQELQQDTVIFRTTNIIMRVRKRYRIAKQRYFQMTRGLKKVRAFAMADEVEKVADYLRSEADFLSNQGHYELCGNSFRGGLTDFEALKGLKDFSSKIRAVCSSLSGHGQSLQDFCLEADIAEIEKVQNLTRSPAFREARKLYSTMYTRGKMEAGWNIENEKAIQDRRRSQLEEILDFVATLHLQDAVDISALPGLIVSLLSYFEYTERLNSGESSESLFGVDRDAMIEQLDDIEHAVECAEHIKNDFSGKFESKFIAMGPEKATAELENFVDQVGASLEHSALCSQETFEAGKIDVYKFFHDVGTDSESPDFDYMADRISRAIDSKDDLSSWAEINRKLSEAEELKLGKVVQIHISLKRPMTELMCVFDAIYFRSLVSGILKKYPELTEFDGNSIEKVIRQRDNAERSLRDAQRKELFSELVTRQLTHGVGHGLVRNYTELSLIKHEIRKRRRHIPIRHLIRRAGVALQEIKPCFMMSPLSIAQFIPQGTLNFDVLVIDEASQMRPEEAMGAFLRSSQQVVVGDPQQLPPTSFFEREDALSEDDEYADQADTESILDLALQRFQNSTQLNYHYRSKHESLIAFSNKHFYDDDLIVFPSAAGSDNDFGVEYKFVDGKYKNSLNHAEVLTTAQSAIEFMENNPNRSLGLVTMNKRQCEFLENEMDRLFALNPRAETYRARWAEVDNGLYRFFVKNLENVQGDERDVIFISTVYGPDAETGTVHQRFGPVNNAAGHRRLNVLFTRAREKVVLFTSLKPEDIRAPIGGNRGPKVLKDYLEYAKSGRLEKSEITGRQPDSPFEEFVIRKLRQNGLEVTPQVGVSGYFIDIGVKDPEDSSRFILGVECDGAYHHSALEKRVADRSRQEHLERLGWTIYRIWSTDWFSDPDKETDKLVRAIKSAQR